MRIATPLFMLGLVLWAATANTGCAPSPTNSEVPNAMVATPDTVRIAALGDTATSSVRLNCGCQYSLQAKALSGDTARIHLTLSATDPASTHTLFFSGVAGTPSGSYSARYALSTTDDSKLHDTVTAFLTVP